MNESAASILPGNEANFLSLHGIYRWGIELIQAVQGIENPILTALMKIITALGTEYVYILITLFVFWCVNEKKGVRLGILILLSAWTNGFLKFLLKQPRPYHFDPSVGLAFEPSYGIPSGHAQLSLVFWFLIASWYGGRGKRAVLTAAILFTLLIGFTRLYLGVHFPTDLLAGWFLGMLILVLYFFLEAPASAVLNGGIPGIFPGGPRLRMISAALTVLGMNALFPQDTSLGGLFLGFCIGYNLMLRYRPFSAAPGEAGQKGGLIRLGLRYLLGLAGTGCAYLILKALLPGESSLWAASSLGNSLSPYYSLSRFLRYGLLGIWVTLGTGGIFLRLNLAERRIICSGV
ncbi:MAG: phosphatase PAP2 family protein [Treponema sp.]|jgi:membrane-associated phospholipid phosphatase|nr:phosphatase PAP2 family protein [Treponema sp.]